MPETLTKESLYEKLRHVESGGCRITPERIEKILPIIQEINHLKKEKNAVILAHSYVNSEIVYGVADFTGDSYKLSKDAKGTTADTIVFAAVRFMAETAKILNPDKEVLIPSEPNGCSLADSITGDDVRRLKKENPGYTFICYINTTADVKAECDVCVTSSNVYDIVERYPSDKIFFVPDKLMGKNVIAEMERRGVKKDIQLYDGVCYVHETYDERAIFSMREKYPGLKVVSHPECNPQVAMASDFVGSTGEMLKYVKNSPDTRFLMLTECGLANRLEVEAPGKKFVGSCTLCKYMKANSLTDILRVLRGPKPADRVLLDETIRQKALRSIERMFEYAEGPKTQLG